MAILLGVLLLQSVELGRLTAGRGRKPRETFLFGTQTPAEGGNLRLGIVTFKFTHFVEWTFGV